MVWQERRASIRHVVELPVRYRIIEEHSQRFNAYSQASSKNVSDSGILFIAEENLSAGTLLELSFPVKDRLFTMRGTVAHSEADSDGGNFKIGIHFPNAGHIFKIKMAEQLHMISEYQRTLSQEEGRIVPEEEAAHRWIEVHSKNFARFF